MLFDSLDLVSFPSGLLFIITILATWRFTHLIQNEKGPLKIFVRLRSLFGILHDEEDIPYLYPDNIIAPLFSCMWCMSIWTSLFCTLIILIEPILLVPLAVSGGTLLLQLAVDNDK